MVEGIYPYPLIESDSWHLVVPTIPIIHAEEFKNLEPRPYYAWIAESITLKKGKEALVEQYMNLIGSSNETYLGIRRHLSSNKHATRFNNVSVFLDGFMPWYFGTTNHFDGSIVRTNIALVNNLMSFETFCGIQGITEQMLVDLNHRFDHLPVVTQEQMLFSSLGFSNPGIEFLTGKTHNTVETINRIAKDKLAVDGVPREKKVLAIALLPHILWNYANQTVMYHQWYNDKYINEYR